MRKVRQRRHLCNRSTVVSNPAPAFTSTALPILHQATFFTSICARPQATSIRSSHCLTAQRIWPAVQAHYQEDLQQLLAAGGDVAPGLEELRNRTFLVWDDDSGQGYAAALEFPVTAGGDYQLLVGASLSALGRMTAGEYNLTVGINAPQVLTGEAQASGTQSGKAIAVLDREALGVVQRVSEITGTISAKQPMASLELVDFDPGDTLQVFVETTSGSLRPQAVVRDFGGKGQAAANVGGQQATAVLERTADGGRKWLHGGYHRRARPRWLTNRRRVSCRSRLQYAASDERAGRHRGSAELEKPYAGAGGNQDRSHQRRGFIRRRLHRNRQPAHGLAGRESCLQS